MSIRYNGYNVKRTDDNIVSNNSFNKYSIKLDTKNEYDNFISFYKNGELINVSVLYLSQPTTFTKDISNIDLLNYIMYIGARNGQEYFTKMNLANFKVYNKALSAEEIKHNYILDKAKYGIEE